MTSRIRQAEQSYYRNDLPAVSVGDGIDVAVKIREGERERVQTFSGTVIKIRGGGLGKTFTVRRIVQGEGVERIFPVHSPVIENIKITRKGRVRRAKLYYLRDRVGKSTRLREVLGKRGIQAIRAAEKEAAARAAAAEKAQAAADAAKAAAAETASTEA